MVSVGVIGGSGGDGRSAGYYTSSVAKGRDDYYTGRGEAPGEWFGAGAWALGLEGEVDADEFRKVVMEATDPVSGERLRRPACEHPVHGVDMPISAPKSASLIYFLGDEQARAAVAQTITESPTGEALRS
jgi:conjugative relaxase-like TrwC/TraI family protein